jgi:uncharacterized repeat protein (TIGR03803 family)
MQRGGSRGGAAALVFAVVSAVRAQTYEVIHDFDGTDGTSPQSALIEVDGAFYGTTNSGGSHNLGTVFRRESNGNVDALHHFAGGTTDGSQPTSALLLGQDGNLWGTTPLGGADNVGIVYRISTGGILTKVHDIEAPPMDGRDAPAGSIHFSAPLVQLQDGTFYGVSFDGGGHPCPFGCGTVFKMDALGNTFADVHKFTITDGQNPTSITVGADGNLYGTTYAGGANGCGTVFRVSPAGGFTSIHDFTTAEGCAPWGAPVQAADGNLYGTLASHANGGGGIYRITPPSTVAPVVAFDPAVLRSSKSALIQASDGFLYGTAPSDSNGGLGALFRATTSGNYLVVHSFTGAPSDGASPSGGTVEVQGWLYGAANGGANADGILYRFPLPRRYCPDTLVRRNQMAVFLLKTMNGPSFVPPACTGDFGDVPCPSIFADWIEALADAGVTAGCGSGNYCPTLPIRRDQMAAFLLKAAHGPTFLPPACQGDFTDVPCPSLFADWVEALADEGITAGCGGGFFCPAVAVTRAQMAVFLLKVEHGAAHTPASCQAVFGDVLCPSPFADWIEELYGEAVTAGCFAPGP